MEKWNESTLATGTVLPELSQTVGHTTDQLDGEYEHRE